MLTEEKATNNVKINQVHPYTKSSVRIGGNIKFSPLVIQNKEELEFLSDEELELEEKANQNSLLVLIKTPRMFENNSPAPPLMVLSTYSHASFVTAFNLLSNEEKKEVQVLRSYWLGGNSNLPKVKESSDINKIVSDYLIETLAEKVRLFKANPLTSRLIPFKKTLDSSVYEGGIDYQIWLEANKGKAKYDFEIVKKLAEGKKPKAINDSAFCFNTPVITDEEINQIIDLVNKKPELTLPYRPTLINQSENIANAIKSALQTFTTPNIGTIK